MTLPETITWSPTVKYETLEDVVRVLEKANLFRTAPKNTLRFQASFALRSVLNLAYDPQSFISMTGGFEIIFSSYLPPEARKNSSMWTPQLVLFKAVKQDEDGKTWLWTRVLTQETFEAWMKDVSL